MSKSDAIRNYDREGKNYDNVRYGRTKGGRFFSELELSKTLGMLQAGKTLHIGTATGRVSLYLVERGHDYVGLEISGVMARIAKEKLNGSGNIVRGDAEHLPFKQGIFDNVVCVRAFHFLPEPTRFLWDAFEVLKANGRLITSFEKRVVGRAFFEKLRIVPSHRVPRKYYYNMEAARLCSRTGFEIRFKGNVTKLPLLVYWRLRKDYLLRRFHHALPYWFGTVGMIVGDKTGNASSQQTGTRSITRDTSADANREANS